jgi:uncharacterized protein with HEPN domain
MKPKTRLLLDDIIDSCQVVLGWCKERDFSAYQADRLFRRAVEREFEIVGEALKRLRDDDPDMFTGIQDAAAIIGFRNRLAHGYDVIDDAVVWGLITDHVPRLITQVRAVLD